MARLQAIGSEQVLPLLLLDQLSARGPSRIVKEKRFEISSRLYFVEQATVATIERARNVRGFCTRRRSPQILLQLASQLIVLLGTLVRRHCLDGRAE